MIIEEEVIDWVLPIERQRQRASKERAEKEKEREEKEKALAEIAELKRLLANQ